MVVRKNLQKVLVCLLSAAMICGLGTGTAFAADGDENIDVIIEDATLSLSSASIDAAISSAGEQTFQITNQMTGDETVTAHFVLITDLLAEYLGVDNVAQITINGEYTSGWTYKTIYGETASYTLDNAWLYKTDNGYGFAVDGGNWALWEEDPVVEIAVSYTITEDPGTSGPEDEDPDPDGLISIGVTSYEAWTTIDERDDEGGQRMHFEFTFDEALSCDNFDALTQEMVEAEFLMADEIHWGNGTDGGTIENVALSDDGKTLHFEVAGYYAPYNGKFVANTILENLTTAEGKYAKLRATFYVPNGLTTLIVSQEVGEEGTASVTTRFSSDENTTRAMIHLTVLLNGEPVNTNENGSTAEGHWHDFLTMDTETFCDWYYETLQSRLGEDWEVTASGDTMTVTYLNAEDDDVVDLHITSYLNTNYAGLNMSTMVTRMEEAEKLLLEGENKKLQDAITVASVRLAHPEHYSQAEINETVTILETAIDEYHDWDEGVLIRQATIGEDGEILYTCTVCGATKTVYFSVETGEIDALLSEADKKNEEDYTVDSWEAFVAARDAAKKVVADLSSTQADVDAAQSALQTALNGLTVKTRTIEKRNGVWTYIVEGEPDYTYTGFGTNSNGKWYVEKGIVTFTKTDILKDTTGAIGEKGDWYYVIDSKVQTSFTGLSNFKNANGWWYIVNGVVDFTHNGVDKNKNGWWYVTGGKVQFSFTGLANYKNANGWWYIESGKVDFTHNGVDKNKNGWWYVTDGKVRFGYTGVADYRNASGWWYIKDGAVDFTHNGVDKNKNGWWYVIGGKVRFDFTGLANYRNANGWWYIKAGKVDFTFRGIATNRNGTWYVDGGKVQFGYSGTVSAGGRIYTVKDGKVS